MNHPRDTVQNRSNNTNKNNRTSNRAARNLAADGDDFGSMIMLGGSRDSTNTSRAEESKGDGLPSSSRGMNSAGRQGEGLISQRSAGMLGAAPTTGSMM